jgi:hypothetical protein
MNSREYAKIRTEQLRQILSEAGITDYKSVCLSADQQEYEVVLKDDSLLIIPSGLPYHYD